MCCPTSSFNPKQSNCFQAVNAFHATGLFPCPLYFRGFLMFSGGTEREQWYQMLLKSLNYFWVSKFYTSCDALRNLVPFVQFKGREQHRWKIVIKSSTSSSFFFFFFFSRFLSCTNSSKSRKVSVSYIFKRV